MQKKRTSLDKSRTWGKVEWTEGYGSVDSGIGKVLHGYVGPTHFASIEELSDGTYQSYIRDPRIKDLVPIAIPYTSLHDLKLQLEKFKDM